MYGASIKQDSCITTMYKKTCFEPIMGGGLIRKWALIIFFSQDGGLLERVGLFKEGQLNREDAAFLSIDSNIYISCFIGKSIFNISILFPGLPSQSSFIWGHFKCSFKSMQSSFEKHNSCRCY